MRIAILPSIKRPITPQTTSSRPRVICDLVGELVKAGHQVTILGTGDSTVPGAVVVPVVPKSLNALPPAENPFYQHTAYLTLVIQAAVARQGEFDVIHNHMYPEFLPLLAYSGLKTPMITTVHAQMTTELASALRALGVGSRLIAISYRAKEMSGIPGMEVVHNGIDTEFFVPSPTSSRDYLLFVGRMSKAKGRDGAFLDPKGVAHAIRIAQLSGERLKIVGNCEDPMFFETIVKPHLSSSIEFVGEVSSEQVLTREQMRQLYRGAKAFISPINWEEPFGLVMAEALSCGVPVIAFKRGSVSEIVRDSFNGFVVDPKDGVETFASKISKLDDININICRTDAVSRFSKSRMAADYIKIYKKVAHT